MYWPDGLILFAKKGKASMTVTGEKSQFSIGKGVCNAGCYWLVFLAWIQFEGTAEVIMVHSQIKDNNYKTAVWLAFEDKF